MLSQLKHAAQQGQIRLLDYQFARFLAGQGEQNDSVLALAALASFELGSGNVCLPLKDAQAIAEKHLPELARAVTGLNASTLPASRFIGDGSSLTPLVLDQGRLYLYRYWQYECAVAADLAQRAGLQPTDDGVIAPALDELFGQSAEPDWQKVAAAVAISSRFSVISGGPGTGKTTTVVRLLAAFIQQEAAAGRSPRIRLVAPTGKAAARLAESISGAVEKLPVDDRIRAQIPREASTLHRLLGVIPDSPNFRHHADNPLHLDLLLVDEASMIDLPMMARLLAALPERARLILIGDRDQLASVEAGSVLGDICSWPGELSYSAAQRARLLQLCQLSESDLPGQSHAPISDGLALLRKSYRFDENSGIGQLARGVNNGDYRAVRQVLAGQYADIHYHRLTQNSYGVLLDQVVAGYRPYLEKLRSGATPEEVVAGFNHFQLLCMLREGDWGLNGLNERIEKALKEARLIQPDANWYPGRPVMVTRNDPVLGLYNGDIGICLPLEDGALRVMFEGAEGLRAILPSRMPEHDTAYAMTVHKSQGSEFARVLMALPPSHNPLLTREMLYTGITRAKQDFTLFATDLAVETCTANRIIRASGLGERLWSL